jgi:hypothetical protein
LASGINAMHLKYRLGERPTVVTTCMLGSLNPGCIPIRIPADWEEHGCWMAWAIHPEWRSTSAAASNPRMTISRSNAQGASPDREPDQADFGTAQQQRFRHGRRN